MLVAYGTSFEETVEVQAGFFDEDDYVLCTEGRVAVFDSADDGAGDAEQFSDGRLVELWRDQEPLAAEVLADTTSCGWSDHCDTMLPLPVETSRGPRVGGFGEGNDMAAKSEWLLPFAVVRH